MANFKELLATTAAVVEKPKPLPQGTYAAIILDYITVESSKQKTPGVQINLRLTAPDADVDTNELEEAGGLAAMAKKKLSTTFYLTEDANYRLKEFLEETCKLELGDRSFAELLGEVQNMEIKVAITHRFSDKGEIFMQVDKTLPAD